MSETLLVDERTQMLRQQQYASAGGFERTMIMDTALDAKGLPISVGDVVLIPCRVMGIDDKLIVELPDPDEFHTTISPSKVVRANPLEVDVTSVLGSPVNG